MKIIFLKDAPRIGRKYEIKEVANGYGRHLIASGVADMATPEIIARIEKKRAQDITEKNIHTDLLLKNIAALEGTKLVLKGKANEKGHLFAAIHREEILSELNRATRLDINPEYIILEKPLKEIGEFVIPVIFGEHKTSITVEVQGL